MAAVDEIKAFASLTSGLLARKGAARPAMRPQYASPVRDASGLTPSTAADGFDPLFDPMAIAQADLGWDDHGTDDHVAEATVGDAGGSAVLRQRGVLEGSLSGQDDAVAEALANGTSADHSSRVALTPMGMPAPRAERRKAGEFADGRRAAFTLRVDHDRHLRLRLACTLQNRSAQQVVTEALDRLLDEMPGLEELARRARRH